MYGTALDAIAMSDEITGSRRAADGTARTTFAPIVTAAAVAPSESVLALSRVTFSVSAGQILGVIGPQNSGKSALLAAILGDARR